MSTNKDDIILLLKENNHEMKIRENKTETAYSKMKIGAIETQETARNRSNTAKDIKSNIFGEKWHQYYCDKLN